MQIEDKKVKISPFVRSKNGIGKIMLDVITAMLPLILFAYLAYGEWSLLVLFSAAIAAIITELACALFFLNKRNTIADGSAVITAILLAFTLSPFTPWYVVSFGAAMAILFGKILWGGLGKNRFNPALLGREFMTAFFPAVMSSGSLWSSQGNVNIRDLPLFDYFGEDDFIQYLNMLFYKTTGAMGEYSVIFLTLGGLYLLIRRRVSWHIPFALLSTFFLLLQVFEEQHLQYSLAGVLLGAIYMATDMPSSPSTNWGKLYYGMMIGSVAILCLLNSARHEYMSYSILILNGFSYNINKVFSPRVWGMKVNWPQKVEQALLLTLSILSVALAVLSLHYFKLTQYLVFLFIVYLIFKFNFSFTKKLSNPI